MIRVSESSWDEKDEWEGPDKVSRGNQDGTQRGTETMQVGKLKPQNIPSKTKIFRMNIIRN